MFYHAQVSVCEKNKILYFCSDKKMNGRSAYSSPFIYAPETNKPRHLLQQFNTHDHFGKLDIFVRKVTHTGKSSIFIMLMNWFSII